ncbi:hypothetical protein L218DRAFT_371247 [Marasmius fiardii PR-910]|nr:hypothetical protein L218DRAFT_371247 [Marasmius fiardii PR-910]
MADEVDRVHHSNQHCGARPLNLPSYHDHPEHHHQRLGQYPNGPNRLFADSDGSFLPTSSPPLFHPVYSSTQNLASSSPPTSTFGERSSYMPVPANLLQGNPSNHFEPNSHTTSGSPYAPTWNGYHPSDSFTSSRYAPTTATSPSLCPYSVADHASRDSFYPNQLRTTTFTVREASILNGHHSTASAPSPPYFRSPSVPNPASISSPSAISIQEGAYMPMRDIRPPSSQESQYGNMNKRVGSLAMTKAGMNRRKDKFRELLYCPILGCTSEGFTEEHNRTYHMLSHEGKRPYPCPKCGRSFRGRGDLKRHVEKKKPCN